MYYIIRVTTFIEQPLFTKQITDLVDDDDYREFQNELAKNPEKGTVVEGCGGLRKVRMALPGRGKSGGARVLYLLFPQKQTIIFYYLYTKGEIDDIPEGKKKGIRNEVQRIKKVFNERDRVQRGPSHREPPRPR